MHAENFVYAPAIMKAEEILRKKGSKILYAKGEESLKGSSSPVAGECIESIYFDRKPKSGFDLAYDTIKIIYAAYKSSEIGRAVEL